MEKKAVGYVRVSTDEQAREGVSLAAQEEQIRRYCELFGLELGEVLRDEGKSGKDMHRPAMAELLRRVKAGEVGAVVTYKLDRVARSTLDALGFAETLRAAGCGFHSVTERIDTSSAHGGFFYTLLAGLGELERRLIVERTQATMAYKKSRGEWVGRPPVGYRVDGTRLMPNGPDLVAQVKRLTRKGHSTRAIGERLGISNASVWRLQNGHGKARKAKYGGLLGGEAVSKGHPFVTEGAG